MTSGDLRRTPRGLRLRAAITTVVLGLMTVLIGGGTVSSQAPAPEASLMRVSADRATLRGKPAADAPPVIDLTRGQEVRVLERAGAWMLVRVVASGQEGFVHGLLLEEVPVTPTAGPPATLQLSVLLVDDQLAVKPVPRHVVLLTPLAGGSNPIRVVAGFDGRVEAPVPPGSYTLASERAVDFQGRTYRWELPLTFKPGERLSIDLSVDNAAGTSPQPGPPVAGAAPSPSSPASASPVAPAVSASEVTGAVAVSGQSSAPVTPAAEVNVVGLWEGTYADSPARLRVTEQVGASFTATLSVTTQTGRADSEIQVTGRVSAGVVELTETAVITRGAARAWSLGRGAGTIDADGRAMRGTGRDGRSEYRWSFTLRVTPAVAPPPTVGRVTPVPAVAAVTPPAPAPTVARAAAPLPAAPPPAVAPSPAPAVAPTRAPSAPPVVPPPSSPAAPAPAPRVASVPATPPAPVPPAPAVRAWTVTVGEVESLAMTSTGTVLARSKTGITAVRPETGERLWERADAEAHRFELELDIALLRLRDGSYSAVDPASGRELWHSRSLGFDAVTEWHLLDGAAPRLLAVGRTAQSPHVVAAVEPLTGRVEWRQGSLFAGSSDLVKRAPKVSYNAVAVQGDTLILDASYGGAIRIDARSGEFVWRAAGQNVKMTGPLSTGEAPIHITDRRVFIANGKTLLILDASTGQVIARRKTNFPSPIFQMELTPRGLLVRGGYNLQGRIQKHAWNSYLALLDPNTGNSIWTTEKRKPKFDPRSTFQVQGNSVLIALNDGIAEVEIATGQNVKHVALKPAEDAEGPCCVDVREDGRLLLTSSEMTRLVDWSGKVYFDRYYKAPGQSMWAKLAVAAAAGMAGWAVQPLLTPAFAAAFARNRASADGDRYHYSLTENPAGGAALVRVDKVTGDEAGRVLFKDRSPVYALNPLSGVVVVAEGTSLGARAFVR